MFFSSLFLCLIVLPQEASTIQEKLTVNYVLLDVMAYHSKKGLIKDLKPDDFVVTENKKKVKVTSFEILDFDTQRVITLREEVPERIATEPKPAKEEPLVSQFIIATDFESASLVEIRRTFSQLDAFLEKLELDRNVKIMLYSLEDGLVTKSFLDNPADVRSALASYKDKYLGLLSNSNQGSGSYRDYEGRVSQPLLNRNLNELETKFRQCRGLYNPNDSNGYPQLSSCIDEELEVFIDIQKGRIERALGELESLAYKFQELPGIKTMFFVSPGFSPNPGSSAIEMASYYKNVASDPTEESASNPDRDFVDHLRTGAATLQAPSISVPSYEKDFRKVIHACIRNRVVFNTVDIYNFGSQANRRDSLEFGGKPPSRVVLTAHRNYQEELNDGLRKLASESGGDFLSTTNLVSPLTKMINEPRFYYVLGYESPAGTPGKFRKIRVKVKKRGVKLRYRQGYFGK